MNKWTLLLILVGLGAIGMLNRDKISASLGHKPAETAEASGEPAPITPVPITPHPAQESIKKARAVYPALAVPDSVFNKKFIELFNAKKASDPEFLVAADWPMKLAQQAADSLGGAVTTYQAPTEVSTSALNARPAKVVGSTVPPSVQLPGLKGSALDQRPPGHK
jgi:hypothetical protein